MKGSCVNVLESFDSLGTHEVANWSLYICSDEFAEQSLKCAKHSALEVCELYLKSIITGNLT